MRMIRNNLASTVGLLSVAVDVDQALIADPEVVRHLVEDDPPDLFLQSPSVVSVEASEWAAVDAERVRQPTAVVATPSRQRPALIEPEQRLPAGRLVF